MKNITVGLFIVFNLSPAWAGGGMIFSDSFEETTAQPAQKNVFISGHSLMDNPYAEYLEALSMNKGTTFNWNQQIGIGSPIRTRTSGSSSPPNNWLGYHEGKNRDTSNMDIISELISPTTIGAGNLYDTLLITERHDLLDTIYWEYTNSLLRHYHDRLRSGNPNGETLLYHSWLDIDPSDPQEWIDHEALMLNAWECVAEKVNLTLENDGLAKSISVIPAGWALTNLVTRILNDEVAGFTGTDLAKIDQLFDDNVHLNVEGIFYMAAVSFVSLYGTSPVGATIPTEINAATGNDLLQIAWENVNSYRQNYQVKSMMQCRQIIETQVCDSYYNFTDRTGEINACKAWVNNSTSWEYNPFNWPDPDLVTWPAP